MPIQGLVRSISATCCIDWLSTDIGAKHEAKVVRRAGQRLHDHVSGMAAPGCLAGGARPKAGTKQSAEQMIRTASAK